MASLSVGCWNPSCLGQLFVECKDTDQAIFCAACNSASAFVNLVAVSCKNCGKRNSLSTRFGNPQMVGLRCRHCDEPVGLEADLRIFTLDDFMEQLGAPRGLNYCGRSTFEGLQSEVDRAKDALQRAGSGRWRLFGRLEPAPKNRMYVRQINPVEVNHPDLPVRQLFLYHAYCNFKANSGHENAKFSGVLGQFAAGEEFEFLRRKGLAEIWFADVKTQATFEALPRLRPFYSMFKTV